MAHKRQPAALELRLTVRYSGLKATQYFSKFTEESIKVLRADLLALRLPHPKKENIHLLNFGSVECFWPSAPKGGILHKNLMAKALRPVADPALQRMYDVILAELSISKVSLKESYPRSDAAKPQNLKRPYPHDEPPPRTRQPPPQDPFRITPNPYLDSSFEYLIPGSDVAMYGSEATEWYGRTSTSADDSSRPRKVAKMHSGDFQLSSASDRDGYARQTWERSPQERLLYGYGPPDTSSRADRNLPIPRKPSQPYIPKAMREEKSNTNAAKKWTQIAPRSLEPTRKIKMEELEAHQFLNDLSQTMVLETPTQGPPSTPSVSAGSTPLVRKSLSSSSEACSILGAARRDKDAIIPRASVRNGIQLVQSTSSASAGTASVPNASCVNDSKKTTSSPLSEEIPGLNVARVKKGETQGQSMNAGPPQTTRLPAGVDGRVTARPTRPMASNAASGYKADSWPLPTPPPSAPSTAPSSQPFPKYGDPKRQEDRERRNSTQRNVLVPEAGKRNNEFISIDPELKGMNHRQERAERRPNPRLVARTDLDSRSLTTSTVSTLQNAVPEFPDLPRLRVTEYGPLAEREVTSVPPLSSSPWDSQKEVQITTKQEPISPNRASLFGTLLSASTSSTAVPTPPPASASSTSTSITVYGVPQNEQEALSRPRLTEAEMLSIQKLIRESWEVKRQIEALVRRDGEVVDELKRLRSVWVPERVDVGGKGKAKEAEKLQAEKEAQIEAELAALKAKLQESESQLLIERLSRAEERKVLEAEQQSRLVQLQLQNRTLLASLEEEKRLREEAEGALSDVRRECRQPFVVPSLLDAFVGISKLTTRGLKLAASAGDDGSGELKRVESRSGAASLRRWDIPLSINYDEVAVNGKGKDS